MRLQEIRTALCVIASGVPYVHTYEYPAGGEALPGFVVLGFVTTPAAWPAVGTTAAFETVTAEALLLVSMANAEQLGRLDDMAQDIPPLIDNADRDTYGWNSARTVGVGEYAEYSEGDTRRLGAKLTVEVML